MNILRMSEPKAMECTFSQPGPEQWQSLQAVSHWYATYTYPRHEKLVGRQLEQRRIEAFVPLYHSIRRWKDRRRQVDLPLFPSYVFVRITAKEHLRVLELPGVVRFVSFNGKPAILPTEDIEALRNGLANNVYAEPHPFFLVGRRVRVVRGPFAGVEGVLVRKKDKLRLVISITAITCSFVVEVDLSDVQPC